MLIARMQQRSERNKVKKTVTLHQIERRRSVDNLRRDVVCTSLCRYEKGCIQCNAIVLITAYNCEYA